MKKIYEKYGNLFFVILLVIYIFSPIKPSSTLRIYIAVAIIIGQLMYIRRLKQKLNQEK